MTLSTNVRQITEKNQINPDKLFFDNKASFVADPAIIITVFFPNNFAVVIVISEFCPPNKNQ